MASSSSLRSKNRWKHDVFLSFRGSDTRNTFIGHLYQALLVRGIDVVIDNELQRGEFITSQLLTLIEESQISIVVLSEKYASSSFCLDELVKALESRESKGQTVIPVFYHVDPTDVRKHRGIFGQEFATLEAQLNKHMNYWKLLPSTAASFLRNVRPTSSTVDDLDEQRNNNEEATENMDRVQKWRLALTEVANLAGWHLEKGHHEADMIQSIVKMVWEKLNYTPLHVAEHPVGLTSRVEFILHKLHSEQQKVCMLGLHGMGGVGKTATVAALYNVFVGQREFEECCFLSKVREEAKKNGIAKLQQFLLFKFLGHQGHSTISSEEGIELIKRGLQNKKVFIVLDDVDDREQLQQLVGGSEWFGEGSIIIVTTRDLHLLEQYGMTMIYEIKGLEFGKASKLFNWYAFKKLQPNEAYKEFSGQIVRYAKGLPLALQVLGSLLYGRNIVEWEDVLKKLKRLPNDKIISVLRISYDSLDSEEKVIFLDIALFFKGKNEDEVIKLIDACGFGAHIGVKRLVEKSLVYVRDGTIGMHDLLEEMATQISKTSHLCIQRQEDIRSLFSKDKNPCSVEGILFDFRGEEEEPLNLLEFTKLRILEIRNGHFMKVPVLPNNIKCLEWRNCPLELIPFEFLPAKLVVLNMPNNRIVRLEMSLDDNWKAKKFMNLRIMDFKDSMQLEEIVMDFSSVPNIEELSLRGCAKLKKIHKSIGSLQQLERLDFGGCYSLKSLPNLGENKRLNRINLSHSSKFENLSCLPTTITHLYLSNTGIKEIPLSIRNLINLEYLQATYCKNLSSVSNSIYKLLPNVTIDLNNCPMLQQLPEAESCMVLSNRASTPYCKLNLSGNTFVSLPIHTFKFLHIRFLYLNNCKWLVEIPELPQTLGWLEARNCKSLVRFSQFQFEHSFDGDFSNCHKIATENEKKSWREMVEKEWRMKRKEDDPLLGYYYNIILPGNGIPEWFSYAFNCHGNDNSFKLPSSLLNPNLIAIACSAIFEHTSIGFSQIQFSMNGFTIGNVCLYSSLESEHMWLGFYTVFDWPELSEDEEFWCQFYCLHAQVNFKRVGIHFIYRN